MMNKIETRDFYLKIRKNLTLYEKRKYDEMIFIRFINSSFYFNFEVFLIYVSVNNEVETAEIIRYLLKNNKKVAVPYCSDSNMEFYYINSPEDLVKSRFGIPSVDIVKSEKFKNFDKALCIVPTVSFDNNGNRIGYGGGYYDRFLAENKLTTLGLCYERCMSENIPSESFDIKMDYVLTEKCLRNHRIKEVSTYG